MKRLLFAALALMLVISLSACNTSSLEEYKQASEKTDQITRGKVSGEFATKIELNTENMTAEEIKELNYYKDMKGSFNVSYDDEAGKSIFRNYLNMGGLGFDFEVFINGEEMFMKLPVVGKYMKLDEVEANVNVEENEEIISEETIDFITQKWISLMNDDDVFKGKDIVLTTPDGEVKTTEYVIKLNDQQIKTLVKDSTDILSKDEKLKSFYRKYIEKSSEESNVKSFESILAEFKIGIDNYNIESFIYTAYVDIDGYIVNETFEISAAVIDPEEKNLKAISYKLNLNNFDINKEQNFDFPVLSNDNTLSVDEMDESMPDMMKDLFNNKD
ncbi:hypothetical protein [Sedimentibacter saalensis]|uniref:Lipoprotein n=1 Tax=Sedimentibacter saalensis TaxID=130788 RepID=A0A562J401_9FIRM|nr:hypothetical protein [Sedimentibacter saalensis]TWH77906.1 hypothetical protein LY60_03094 [Sedimentibacter saalensis]